MEAAIENYPDDAQYYELKRQQNSSWYRLLWLKVPDIYSSLIHLV